LDALYVGAYIEQLDMLDIVQCPQVIIDMHGRIKDVSECGLIYIDNSDIQSMYESLIEGSENHLRSYVTNIESVLGECQYEAQVLTQKEVDAILVIVFLMAAVLKGAELKATGLRTLQNI